MANFFKNGTLYIIEDLEATQPNYFIADLKDFIFSYNPETNTDKTLRITGPYDIKGPNVLDIFINSYGGDIKTYSSIEFLINMARSKGIIIRTTVTGVASTTASALAVQGTPGFRIMGYESYHFIPHVMETKPVGFIKEKDEEDYFCSLDLTPKQFDNLIVNYLRHTKITKRQLNALIKNERLDSIKSLKYGFCDWILSPEGYVICEAKQK